MFTILHPEEAEWGGMAESRCRKLFCGLSVHFPGVSGLVCVTVHVVCPKGLTSEQMPELVLPRGSEDQD